MAHLQSLQERLENKKMSGVEKAVRRAHEQLLQSIQRKGDLEMLSFSCGDGIWDYLSALHHSSIKKIIATDIVDNPVRPEDQALLRTHVAWEFQKIQPDTPLPFRDEQFDIVIHHDVIEHTYKPFLVLTEQYRTIKKGGYLLFGTPNLLRPANVIKLLLGRLHFPVKIGYNEELGDYVHVQEFYEQQLCLMVQEIGFEIKTFQHCYFGFHPLDVCFSQFPQSNLGKGLCHYFMVLAEKPAK